MECPSCHEDTYIKIDNSFEVIDICDSCGYSLVDDEPDPTTVSGIE